MKDDGKYTWMTLRELTEECGVKQSWIARQLGLDRQHLGMLVTRGLSTAQRVEIEAVIRQAAKKMQKFRVQIGPDE